MMKDRCQYIQTQVTNIKNCYKIHINFIKIHCIQNMLNDKVHKNLLNLEKVMRSNSNINWIMDLNIINNFYHIINKHQNHYLENRKIIFKNYL